MNQTIAPWFRALNVQAVLALTLTQRADRRALLDVSALQNLPASLWPHYVYEPRCSLTPDQCAMEGWKHMLREALERDTFPILLVEDDIDFHSDGTVSPRPSDWDIVSLASVHHNPQRCQRVAQVAMLRPDSWRNWGNAALLFSSRGAVTRLLYALNTRKNMVKHKTIDMKLFTTGYSNVWIACPPLLRWITSHSDVLNATRIGSL